jgi:GT2 family glycosyltransferase
MISIVVPTYSRPALLREQLEALAAQQLEEPWEVVVADNSLTGIGRDVVAEFADRIDVRHVDASARRGVSAARNVGVRHSRGALLAFLDDDDLVAPGWLPAIRRALDAHPVVAARLDHDRLNPPWLLSVRGRPQASSLWTWYRMPDFAVPFAGTIAVRREVHESIGGWDEELPTHEDADYTLRLRRAGYDVHLEADAVIFLRHRPTLGANFSQALFYGDALPAFYRKHEPLGLPRPPRTAALRGWLGLARSLVSVRDRATLGAFLWQLGWRVGLVRGSVRHRYLLLSE